MSSPTTLIPTSLTAQNTFSNWLQLDKGQMAAISIAGVTNSTVTLQRKFNANGDIRDVESWTAPEELAYTAECAMEIRVGIKTGGYGSDTVVIDMKTG